MIKVKDGYGKLIGTTYLGVSNRVLLSNGGDFELHTGRNNEANKLVRTDNSGYILTGWINTTSGDRGTAAINKIYCSNDDYIRYKTPANFFESFDNSENLVSLTIGSYNRKLTIKYATNSHSALQVFTGRIGGTNHAEALKTYFTNNKSVIPRNALISVYSTAYNNGSQGFGYFLTGYDNNPYGGFFIANYNTPYYVGILNGSYLELRLLTHTNYTGTLDSRYYTKTESDNRFVNISGDTMTGPLVVKASITGTLLISTTSTGTAPFAVSSTTIVSNLNVDLLDGKHSTFFKRIWYGNAGKNYIGWIKLIEWKLSKPNHFSPYPFTLYIYRSYNSPTSESYTLQCNFGWGNASINQIGGKAGNRIIEKFRISKTSDGLTYFLEMYVNTSYTTYQNTCTFIMTGHYIEEGKVLCEVLTASVINVNEITTNANYMTTTGYVKNGSSDNYVLLGGGGHLALSSLPSTAKWYWANIPVSNTSSTSTQPTFYNTKILGSNATLHIKNTNSQVEGYSVIRLGNHLVDNAATIFLNGPNRINDGGNNMMTIRNNVGNLRLDNNVYITQSLDIPKLRIIGATENPNWNSIGAITWTEDTNNSEAVSLVYTPYDSYRFPAGLKLLGKLGNEWLEAPRFIKSGSDDDHILLGGGGDAYLFDFYKTNFIGLKNDYEYVVILLFKDAEIKNHRITGKIYSKLNGSNRYCCADLDCWFSRWSTAGFDHSFYIMNHGLHKLDLVTCNYLGAKWWGLRHTNIQAKYFYFVGTAENTHFTTVKYFKTNTSQVLDSEINNSIANLGNVVKRMYNGNYTIAYTSDLKNPVDYYWANVKVSNSSSTTTSPTFANATVSNKITTPTINTTGVLTLSGTTGIYFKYNNNNTKSLVLNNTLFKPFDTSNGKLDLGSSSARWKTFYSQTGNFSGTVTSAGFIKTNSSDSYVLLGGGGHKSLSELSTSHNHDNIYWKVNGLTTKGNGDIYLEMWRGANASWKILNSSGNLYFLNNYVNSAGSYFNVLTLNYNTGNATFKGNITCNQVHRNATGVIWIDGRRGALLRETSSTGYHTLWSLKTTNGSWDFGEYNSTNWNNIPVLSYITDSDYNSGNNNPTYQIKFPLASGTVALTNLVPTVARYNTTTNTSYIKIKINSTKLWMLGFNVRIYQNYKYYDIRFSGYNYGSNYWYSPKASLVEGDSTIKIYFGYESVGNLWVGILGSSYTGVEISNVTNGYTSHGMGELLSTLFTISNVSSLSTIQTEATLSPPAKKTDLTWDNIINKPSIPTVTDYYWANIKVSSSPLTNTSPTFANVYGNNGFFNWVGADTNKSFSIGANNGHAIYISTNNRVGIGISNPSDKLQVAGLIRLDSNNVYLKLGPQNSYHACYETNASASHWFNKMVEILGICRPYEDNKYSSGDSIKRWSNIYSYVGTFTNSLTVGGNTVWHAGNDGNGSGLDADKLDGYHREGLYSSIPNWINVNKYTKSITINGDSSTYYPVVIDTPINKEFPGFISVWKNLGTQTASYPGNHPNGSSSMWLLYECRKAYWDGNGGYFKCLYHSMPYSNLCAKAEVGGGGSGRLIIYLRGGGTLYYISTTYGVTADIYMAHTNIESIQYPVYVTPTSTLGNLGILSTTYIGYGNITGSSAFVRDILNGNLTTFAYSKSNMEYKDFTYLAAWNGYELRSVNKDLFATKSSCVTSLGTNGNYLTWTKNGTINNITIPYASSSGHTTRLYANSTSNLTTAPGEYSLSYARFLAGVSNSFPTSNNANGVITAHTHAGNYYALIGLSSDGRMYYRFTASQALTAGVSWNTIAWVSDLKWENISNRPSSLPANGGTSDYANRLKVLDIRGANRNPNYFNTQCITAWFNQTGTPDSNWYSGITVKGWMNDYASWELCSYSSTGTANNYRLYHRNGNNSTWGSWKTIAYTSDLTWNSIAGKPSTFTPSSHTHNWSEITGKPSSFTPSSHTHIWSLISGAPATATRWPNWGEVTDKPTTFTPSSHTHPYLPLSGGRINVGATVSIASKSDTNSDYSGGLELREQGFNGVQGANNLKGPSLTFHWSGLWAGRLAMQYDGTLNWNHKLSAGGFKHTSVNSNDYMLLAGGGYRSLSDIIITNHITTEASGQYTPRYDVILLCDLQNIIINNYALQNFGEIMLSGSIYDGPYNFRRVSFIKYYTSSYGFNNIITNTNSQEIQFLLCKYTKSNGIIYLGILIDSSQPVRISLITFSGKFPEYIKNVNKNTEIEILTRNEYDISNTKLKIHRI